MQIDSVTVREIDSLSLNVTARHVQTLKGLAGMHTTVRQLSKNNSQLFLLEVYALYWK